MTKLISIQRDGKTYVGEYSIMKEILTVTAMFGSKRTQAGTREPRSVALDILAELVVEGKATDKL